MGPSSPCWQRLWCCPLWGNQRAQCFQSILQCYVSPESKLLCQPPSVVLCPPDSTSVTWACPSPTWLSGLLRPTEKVGRSFFWERVMDYFARAAGKMGTSEWPISVVLIFRRQPDELKRGWTDSLRDSLFCLIGMMLASWAFRHLHNLHPPMNQPFKSLWVYWSTQNSGRETVIGKCTHLLLSLVLWVNLCHQIREEWKKKVLMRMQAEPHIWGSGELLS